MIFIYIIKFICLFLGFTVITKTYYDYKKSREGLTMLLFWIITWLIVIYSAIAPEKVYLIIQHFSDRHIGIGTFAGIAFVFLFFITYRIYVKANRLEQKLKELVTKIGLEDIKNKIR